MDQAYSGRWRLHPPRAKPPPRAKAVPRSSHSSLLRGGDVKVPLALVRLQSHVRDEAVLRERPLRTVHPVEDELPRPLRLSVGADVDVAVLAV